MEQFSALLALCQGESTGHRWISLHQGQWGGVLIFFLDLPLNKRLSKQSRRRWFETPSRSLWRHCYELHPVTLHMVSVSPNTVNLLKSRQNCRHFADDIFCISWNKNVWISLKISLKFVPNVRNNNIQPLVQIMARCRPGYKPLSEPMMVSLLTHICVTRPQSLLQTLI